MSISSTKILIVDDEPDILEFLGYNLKKEGYDVYKASNGLQAIEIAKKDPVHPKLNGLHIIPLDNTAASLYQPELHTPPPKQA